MREKDLGEALFSTTDTIPLHRTSSWQKSPLVSHSVLSLSCKPMVKSGEEPARWEQMVTESGRQLSVLYSPKCILLCCPFMQAMPALQVHSWFLQFILKITRNLIPFYKDFILPLCPAQLSQCSCPSLSLEEPIIPSISGQALIWDLSSLMGLKGVTILWITLTFCCCC